MIRLNFLKQLAEHDNSFQLKVDADARQGAVTAVCGPSGAGKTTLLKVLAGLLRPEQGSIVVNGDTWSDAGKRIFLDARHRPIGFVFQDYALFPNMSVRENLEFACDEKTPRPMDEIFGIMDIMEIIDLRDRKPDSLSGGQKQRVALARAIVRKPKLLLLDEPLAALDAELRKKMQDYLLKIHHHYGLTTFMVSHDTAEIMRLADRVLLLNRGTLVGFGHPSDIFPRIPDSGNILTFERRSYENSQISSGIVSPRHSQRLFGR